MFLATGHERVHAAILHRDVIDDFVNVEILGLLVARCEPREECIAELSPM